MDRVAVGRFRFVIPGLRRTHPRHLLHPGRPKVVRWRWQWRNGKTGSGTGGERLPVHQGPGGETQGPRCVLETRIVHTQWSQVTTTASGTVSCTRQSIREPIPRHQNETHFGKVCTPHRGMPGLGLTLLSCLQSIGGVSSMPVGTLWCPRR